MTTQTHLPSFDLAAIPAPGSFRLVESRPLASDCSQSIRRRLTPQSGRALEILGHAIEYLADETAMHPGEGFEFNDPRLQAIQLLMRANRNLYYAAPILPSFGHRLRNLFGFS